MNKNKEKVLKRVPIAENNICIKRDDKKCINCGACKGICMSRIGVFGHYDMQHENIRCINCGQCSLICPTGSISEVLDYKKVIKDIENDKTVIFQIAPSVRFLLGDEFGYKPGKNVQGKIITALKILGASYVFDTSFGADLTICEEANEFIDRINNNERLPLMTSCCPSWVKYVSEFYPKYKKNLSTTKSPVLMMGAVIKNYFAKKKNLDNVVVVAVVPCTAKKYEISKTDDVDIAITVRELGMWIREAGINFRKLENSRFDSFDGTGAGILFGASGGVTESMLRYVYHKLTNRSPYKKILEYTPIRGLDDIKIADIKIKDHSIKIAVVNGTGDVPKLIKMMEDEKKHFDIIEVMACDGGCIAGGGGSRAYKINNDNKKKRISAIYRKDKGKKRRSCYENPLIRKLYKELLVEEGSDVAKKLLHVREE